MRCEVVPAESLTPDLEAAWEGFRAADPALVSPFFAAGFCRCVARVRPNTSVAVVRDGNDLVGFLPFHRNRFGIGKALAYLYGDYHGLVARPGAAVDAAAVVRACGLRTFDFLYVPSAQRAFAPHVRRAEPSPVVRLAAYQERAADWRKQRRLERELGPVEFRAHDPDRAAYALLCRWKAKQCARTGFPDMLAATWLRDLLWEAATAESAGFRGALSTLRAGGRVVAVHAGLRPTAPGTGGSRPTRPTTPPTRPGC
jgi:CelD/BcsL family acetyltransferase involved in cellulose biosynthesis